MNTIQRLSTDTNSRLANKYKELRKESHRYGERNDCTVIATALVYDMSYNDTHKILYGLGRQHRRGFDTDLIMARFGRVSAKRYLKQPSGSKYTVKTIINTIPVGKFLVFTSGHVLACIDGKIYDWTEDRKHTVKYIVEIDSIMDLL